MNKKMPEDDAWVISAMSDNAMVAELLLRLKDSSETFADRLLVSISTEHMSPPVGWGKHKLRSIVARKEKSEATRCSPKTPLWWSGGGCVSGDGCASGGGGLGGGGGTSASDLYDESSRGSDGKSIDRSKGSFCIDVTAASVTAVASISVIDKRCRKKMTYSELIEEEILQLKENVHLKKEIANLQMTVEGQKAVNHSLKRMKMTKLVLQSTDRREEVKKIERKFVLPDLNLVPVDD